MASTTDSRDAKVIYKVSAGGGQTVSFWELKPDPAVFRFANGKFVSVALEPAGMPSAFQSSTDSAYGQSTARQSDSPIKPPAYSPPTAGSSQSASYPTPPPSPIDPHQQSAHIPQSASATAPRAPFDPAASGLTSVGTDKTAYTGQSLSDWASAPSGQSHYFPLVKTRDRLNAESELETWLKENCESHSGLQKLQS